MTTNELLPVIYDNFDAFHTMCLATSLMSTYNNKAFDSDAHRIITFIGEAFKLPQEMICAFEHCILGDMMNIGLITDYQAVASTELLSDHDKDNIELYEIKGCILEEIAIAEAQIYNTSEMSIANKIKSNMKYEYFHHPYNAKFRFWQLDRLMKNGNVDITRQIAVLYTLGIGCDQDLQKAEEGFWKCILWGDEISAILIDELYLKRGVTNSEYHKLLSDDLMKGICDIKIQEYGQLMRFLKAYIIAPRKDPFINHELADVLISDELPYQNKVELILNFNEKTWRNVSVSTHSTDNRIGFRVRKDE